MVQYAAIDPMSMILSGSAYLRWVELHHPHEIKVLEVQQALRAMTPEDEKATLARARTLAQYGKAVEEAIATMKK